MAEEKTLNYLFWIGIAAVVVVIVIFMFMNKSDEQQNIPMCNLPYVLVGTSCCLDKNSNSICDTDEKSPFDSTKIEITALNSYNIDLYWNGNGGPYIDDKYITIKNNNDDIAYFALGFSPAQWDWWVSKQAESSLSGEACKSSHSIFINPRMIDFESDPIEVLPHDSRTLPLQSYSGSACLSLDQKGIDISPPTKNIKIATNFRVILAKTDKEENINKLLIGIPVEITLHCIDSSTGLDDCKELSKSWS